MKIVVLDGFTLNPGDLSWQCLRELGELTVYERTEKTTASILKAIGDAEIVITNKTPLTREIMAEAPRIRYIGVLATGYNVVDVTSAGDMGITVTNIPGYATLSVAQFTFALLLEMCHHVGDHDKAVKEGQWTKSGEFCMWISPLIELAGKSMGIIGFGAIGRATASLAKAFGMQVLAIDKIRETEPESPDYHFVSFDELLAGADIISLHCPLTNETAGLINRNTISKMKDGVMIINTARGPLIVEEDLCEALNSGKVAGAALDVVTHEPVMEDSPLLKAKNCIITPHIAWAPEESRKRLLKTAADNLEAFLEGKAVNVVS